MSPAGYWHGMVVVFLTDALGLALLVPPLRRWLVGAALPGLAAPRRDRGRPEQPVAPRKQPIVIEGTFQRLDDDVDTKG